MPAADEGSAEDGIHDCVYRIFQQVADTAGAGERISFGAYGFLRTVDSGDASCVRKGGESGDSHSAVQHLLQSPAVCRSVYPANVGRPADGRGGKGRSDSAGDAGCSKKVRK